MKKVCILISLFLMLTACSSNTGQTTISLMADINRNNITPIDLDTPQENSASKAMEITDFSLDIFANIYEGKNTLISPLSIISVLSMTANGANDETLNQMEEAFGADIDSLNNYLYAYRSYLPTDDEYKVSIADSIWLKDEETLYVEEEFLQTNKDYYDAEVFKAPFDDGTKNDINSWVNDKTEGQITKLLEQSPPKDAVMYLINALSFDAEWHKPYIETSIREGEFTTQTGEKKTVDFMHGSEHSYIELPNAIGFTKPYADEKYSFVALLPDESLAIEDFTASLDSEILFNAIENQSDDMVFTSIPKFSFDYETELSEVLKTLGISDAFDVNAADFRSLGQSTKGNIYISKVIHKTKIEVDERGTKAGAVTVAEIAVGSAGPLDVKLVELDRPFFFMIVDNEYGMPIFMGVLSDVT